MRAQIIPPEDTVVIDGRRAFVDCSTIAESVALVQWFGQNGTVHAPTVNGEEGPVDRITSLEPYQPFINAALIFFAIEDEPPVPTLAAFKASAILAIDAEAGMARARFITVAPGQEMTYLEKSFQAQALLADQGPYDAAKYPLIFAEVGVTAPSAAEVAQTVVAIYQAWRVIAAVIERERLTAKVAIAAASSAEEIAEIVGALSWPKPE